MQSIGIGLVGTGFMGKCHALAYGIVKAVFGEVPRPRLVLLCDVDPAHTSAKASEFGFERWTTDWQALIADPNVDLVAIATPNELHKEIATAALAAGKHVHCEKPMALTLADAEAMAAAARTATGKTLLGYNYVCNPAVQHAKRLIAEGVIGEVFDFRGGIDEDYMADPELPWTWRLSAEQAGLGTLGDLTCHLVSVAHDLVGPISEVMAIAEPVHAMRPLPRGAGRRAAVENDDVAHALVRFQTGARGTLASSRIAHGRKNGLSVEVHGSKGTITLNNERMNELELFVAEGPPAERGFRTILSGPLHPPYDQFCPAPGHGLGFNDLKTIEAAGFLSAIAHGAETYLSFEHGLMIERVIHAMVKSARERRWVRIG
jgi:predicted dehydrogenase